MADEAQLDAAVKATMATMGKLIKKPPMTDKLLKKPPFRFLHDVITEVSFAFDVSQHHRLSAQLASLTDCSHPKRWFACPGTSIQMSGLR